MLVEFPRNPGYLIEQLTELELAPIRAEVAAIAGGQPAESAQQLLAGNLGQEYLLSESRGHVEQVVAPRIQRYIQGFGYDEYLDQQAQGRRLELDLLWVNFQRRGEFNPPHWHQGQFSFVIWLTIPYSFEQERQWAPSKNYPVNGDFHFQWTNTLGQIRNHSLLADVRLEGHLVVFPATMMHTVFPFYSTDQARVSVSGNWQLRV